MIMRAAVKMIILFGLLSQLYDCCVCIAPVILIPGDGGSQMEAKLNKPTVVHYLCDKTTKDYYSLWLNMELLVPVIIDCLIDNMRLVYNNVTRKTQNSPGVDIRIPGFGNSLSVEWIDPSLASEGAYFHAIGEALISLGYSRNTSIRGAPYDFRRAPNENEDFFTNLKKLIEDTYAMNDGERVILLAHSMGALMSLEMLRRQTQSWKDKHIRSLITIGGVWGGSVKAVKVFAIGDDLGVYVLRQSVLRAEQISSPSLAWLLPSPKIWKSDDIFVQTSEKNYSLSNLQDFFTDIDYINGWYMTQDVAKYKFDSRAPGVEMHCLHGFGVPTVERLVYAKGTFPTGSPTLIYGDGDGTVNIQSLRGCLLWNKGQKQKIYHQVFRSVDHMASLYDENVLEYIKKVILGYNKKD